MKKYLKALVLAMTVFACCGCGAAGDRRFQYADTAMGTVLRQSVYAENEAAAKETAAEVTALLERLESQTLSWRSESSELSEVNRSAGSAGGYLLSEELTRLLTDCREVWESSEGAFDVTLLPVARLWDIDTWSAAEETDGFDLPTREELERVLACCGCEKLILEPELIGEDGEVLRSRIRMPQGLSLDLGAVAKGAVLEDIAEVLRQNRVSGAVISVGGSVLTYGQKPDGTPWKVGIVDPRDTSANIAVLSLTGQWCVSTSGDYERFVEKDGVRYHHIIDPATGRPAESGVRSVTVLSRDGFLCDALSTACFILGPDKGMALARQYGAETLFVTGEGEIVMSEGMESYAESVPHGTLEQK